MKITEVVTRKVLGFASFYLSAMNWFIRIKFINFEVSVEKNMWKFEFKKVVIEISNENVINWAKIESFNLSY